jgi:tetratricopeptide (TPR) repeat protein
MKHERSLWLIAAMMLLVVLGRVMGGPPPRDGRWSKEFEAGTQAYEKCHFCAAEKHLTQALRAATEFELGDERTVRTLNKLGLVCLAEGKFDAAEQTFRRACAIAEVWIGQDTLAYAECLHNRGALAMMRTKGNNYHDAEALFKQALRLRQKLLPSDDPVIAASLSSLADLDTRRGRYDEADSFLRRALTIREKGLGSNHPAVAQTLNDMGLLRAAQGRAAEAEAAYRKALDIYGNTPRPPACEVAVTLKNYSALLRANNRAAEADHLETQSLAMAMMETKQQLRSQGRDVSQRRRRSGLPR